MIRFLIALSTLIFTLEHPYFIALSSVLFLFNHFIKEEEKMNLKKWASKGTDWLRELNAFNKDRGITMKEGREQVSDLLTTFSNLDKVQLEKFLVNDVLKDKVNSFIIQELIKEEVNEVEWEAYPLEENDLVEDDERKFISYLVPDFDWSKNYTAKDHRQLFKSMKAYFRNPDGSIKDETGSKVVLLLEQWIYSVITHTEGPEEYGFAEYYTDYLFNEEYKNA